jgi:isopentenyl phosphate kinase
VLVKLGGSLITDKRTKDTVREDVLERLAAELFRAAGSSPERVVLGHGGGSFGHAPAARCGLNRGALSPEQLPGVAETQERTAVLHGLVVAALRRAGAVPFSLSPSSFVLARSGRPTSVRAEPLVRALEVGVLPVVHGDVVLDLDWGAAVCSTERLFLALVPRLARAGWTVRRALWLGETEGVWDGEGRTIERIDVRAAARLGGVVSGSPSADVTGGMAHRLETAARLARLGVASWIGDGRVPGRLRDALAGRPVPGTRVEVAAGSRRMMGRRP